VGAVAERRRGAAGHRAGTAVGPARWAWAAELPAGAGALGFLPGKASTHGVDLLPSGFYCPACPGGCRPLVGTDAGPAIHAWRGSTAEPAAGRSPAPGGAASVVLTADGRSLPSVPSWLGPPPFPGGWPDAVRSSWSVPSTHGVDLLPAAIVPTRVGTYLRCVPSSRLACGNWNALSAS